MPWVWVSVGSNIERELNLCAALRALRERFGTLRCSPVYETPAEGFDGEPFYNLVAGFATDLPAAELHRVLRLIEADNGRVRDGEKFGARTLDIDALTYGDQVGEQGGKWLPRDEILRYAFVLRPLADIAPDETHPEDGRRYADLWAGFEGAPDAMRRVTLDCA